MHMSEWRVILGVIQEICGHILLRIEYYDWKRLSGESITIQPYYAHNIIMFIVYFIFLTNISKKYLAIFILCYL